MQPTALLRGGLLSCMLVVAGFGFASRQVMAQVAPSLTTPEPEKRPLTPGRSIELPAAVGEAPPPGSEEAELKLIGIVIEGNPPPDVAVSGLWTGLLDQRINVARLYQLASAVERQYNMAGYSLVRVVVPQQRILAEGARLRLTVIDGMISQLDLDALPESHRASVRAFLAPLVNQPLLRLSSIERQVSLAAELAGLRLRTAVAPGASTGQTTLVVSGERQAYSFSTSVDNSLSPDLGSRQMILNLGLNSLLALGERFQFLMAGGLNDDGFSRDAPRRFGMVSTHLPVGTDGWKLGAQYAVSKTRVQSAAGIIAGNLQRSSFSADYPVVLNRSGRWQLSAMLELLDETLRSERQAVTFSRDRLTSVQLGSDSRFCRPDALCWGLSLALTAGLDLFGARTRDDAANSGIPLSKGDASSRFLTLGYGANASGPIGDSRWSWLVNLRAQHSMNATLPSSQQFSISGSNAVSGLDSGAVSGDEGYHVRTEVLLPVYRQNDGKKVHFSPYGVLAHGQVGLVHPSAAERRSSVANVVGVGVHFGQPPVESGRAANLAGSIEATRLLSSSAMGIPDGSNRITVRLTISY